MKIKFVTLTGADDKTDASKMAELSQKFPFVEWAILFSQTKSGNPRYPSDQWIEASLPKLASCFLSAHLCGKWVSDAMDGVFTFQKMSSAFGRIQLNMAGSRLRHVLADKTKFWEACEAAGFGPRESLCMDCEKPQLILGGPYLSNSIPVEKFNFFKAAPLFDCSGGRGITSDNWLEFPAEMPLCGYAGGLGPDNIEEQLKKLEEVVGDNTIWIDMESKIRTDDEFDLEKCEKVLSIVAEYKWNQLL